MPNKTRIPVGKVSLSPQALMLNFYYKMWYNKSVPIPASLSQEIFVFDFEQILNREELFAKRSTETNNILLTVAAKLATSFDNTDVTEILTTEEIESLTKTFTARDPKKDKDVLANVDLKAMTDRLKSIAIEQVIKNSIAPSMIRDALTVQQSSIDWQGITFSSITSAVAAIQSNYSSLANSESIISICEKWQELVKSNPVMKIVYVLYDIFTSLPGPLVNVRQSYIMDIISEKAFKKPIVTLKHDIKGLTSEITSIDLMDEASFSTFFLGLVAATRAIQNLGTSGLVSTMSDTEFQDYVLTGVMDNQLMLPGSIKLGDMKTAHSTFQQLWLIFAIDRLITANFGSLGASLNSIMEERRYRRDDAYASVVRMMVDINSIIFTAFLDTASFFKTALTSLDWPIKFLNQGSDFIHPRKQELLITLVTQFLEKNRNFVYPTSHPRYLYQPALLVNHVPVAADQFFMDQVTPEVLYDKKTMSSAVRIYADPKANKFLSYLRSSILVGSHVDVAEHFSPFLIPLTTAFSPVYKMTIPQHELLNTPVISAIFKVLSLKDVMRSKIADYLLEQGSLVLIRDEEHLANMLSMPLKIASLIFKNNKNKDGYFFLIDFRDIHDQILFWDKSVAPIYEFFTFDKDDTKITPFISYYPYLTAIEHGSFTDITELGLQPEKIFQKEVTSKLDSVVAGLEKIGKNSPTPPLKTKEKEKEKEN